MSIFDFPRLHFQGFARTHAPTGHKNGLVDLTTNTVYMNGDRFDDHRPISEYHEHLYQLGPRFNSEGNWDENGPFSMGMGWDFGGMVILQLRHKLSALKECRDRLTSTTQWWDAASICGVTTTNI